MYFLRHPLTLFLITSLLIGQAGAKTPHEDFYRNFWSPTYHVQRLNYCTLDGKECGLAVANKYCKMMGYKRAKEALIDYNVGLTNYLLTKGQCRGWSCNGFTLITCVGSFANKPIPNYYYRAQRFTFPRFDQYRVDWCYENGQHCGERSAYSFCRRMGYKRALLYKKQDHVTATKALGNQKLCFGDGCNGFSSITCYR